LTPAADAPDPPDATAPGSYSDAPPVIGVIPARFGSTRFPGKPLASDTGRPLIQHVHDQARRAARLQRVLVATDDARIADAAGRFRAEAVMTSADHPNGASRIAEALDHLHPPPPDNAIIVNIQGDEPEIDPAVIDRLVDTMLDAPDAPMATIASPFPAGVDPHDPNIVKVVVTARSPLRALYFSRAAIPHPMGDGAAPPLQHVGLYAYHRGFLRRYLAMTPTPLERAERLEQLRVLEHGEAILVVVHPVHHTGIDTPEQYRDFVKRYRSRTPTD